jgi:hypothetical protein
MGQSLSVGNLNATADDAQSVPGTVPRRQPGAKPPVGGRKRLVTQVNGNQPKRSTGPPSPPTNERMLSMMSQATYVLENDKRKPLLVQSGLKAGRLYIHVK